MKGVNIKKIDLVHEDNNFNDVEKTINLITGIGGFVASHLVDLLLDKQEQVFGTARWTEDMSNIKHIRDKITICPMDLNDLSSCIKVMEEVRPNYVFHLAAQSFPNESFVYPKVTIETNMIGTLNLLEAIRMVRDRSDDFDPVVHVCSCHDEQTEVLTKRGFLNYKEIRSDDEVVSIDPKSKIVGYYSIKNILVQKYNGDMYKVDTRSIDLLITPNHKLLFSSKSDGELKFGNITELDKPTKRYYMPSGRYSGDCLDKFLVGNKYFETKDLFYLVGMYVGDGYSRTQIKKNTNKSGLSREDFVARKNAKGQFVSGRTGVVEVSKCHSHRVFLAIPDGDKARFPAMKCLSSMGINFKLYKDEIYFTSREFVDFFDQFGHTAYTKHIPEWMFEYDAKFLDCLYKGLIDSDGYYYKTGERYTTVSQSLSDDLIKLCCFIGKFSTVSISEERESSIKGRIIKASPAYRFSISSNSRLVENKNVDIVNYSGDVWCLEVDGVHNFVVRRNGKSHFCGNSSEVYGLVTEDLVPIKEDCRFNPANPYGVGKVGTDMIGLMYFTNYGLKTIRTRMFSHSGLRRKMLSAEVNFAQQIARIEAGKQEPVLKHGNLDSIRTWADVRDAVRAYYILVRKCVPGEVYNIGGNTTKTIGEMLHYLLSLSSIGDSIKLEQDPKLLRPYDVTLQIPDCSKFKNATGWEPSVTFEKLMQDLLDWCRQDVESFLGLKV